MLFLCFLRSRIFLLWLYYILYTTIVISIYLSIYLSICIDLFYTFMSVCVYIQFDILQFFPFISKNLFKSLNHTKNFIGITKEQIEIILTCRKSILTDKSARITLTFPWELLTAKIAGLIDVYIFNTLSRIIDLKQVGLYGDDGLIFIPDINGLKALKIH